MHILHVVGARPNFMKAAPVVAAFEAIGVRQTLVHSGQHYDRNMSDIFFEQLGIRKPDVNLEVGSGSHAQQTAAIMMKFEPVVIEQQPDLVLIYGDVNSTVSVALVCAKLGVKLGHVEAGLRSFDRAMPEEINRLVTDQLSDLLFTPSEDGDVNLRREGISEKKVFLVGNVMIDTLYRLLPIAEAQSGGLLAKLGIVSKKYGLVTLHRPSNVDDPAALSLLLGTLNQIAARIPLVFPIHPRTLQKLGAERDKLTSNMIISEPLGYMDFLALQKHSAMVITDSGGIQEETTTLGVPCFTLRENTERPVTVTHGTNILIGHDMALLRENVDKVVAGSAKKGTQPPLWDGKASERIAAIVTENSETDIAFPRKQVPEQPRH